MTNMFAFAVANARQEFQPNVRDVATSLEQSGPRECCADYAAVIDCTNDVDVWECPFCGFMWSALCR